MRHALVVFDVLPFGESLFLSSIFMVGQSNLILSCISLDIKKICWLCQNSILRMQFVVRSIEFLILQVAYLHFSTNTCVKFKNHLNFPTIKLFFQWLVQTLVTFNNLQSFSQCPSSEEQKIPKFTIISSSP